MHCMDFAHWYRSVRFTVLLCAGSHLNFIAHQRDRQAYYSSLSRKRTQEQRDGTSKLPKPGGAVGSADNMFRTSAALISALCVSALWCRFNSWQIQRPRKTVVSVLNTYLSQLPLSIFLKQQASRLSPYQFASLAHSKYSGGDLKHAGEHP